MNKKAFVTISLIVFVLISHLHEVLSSIPGLRGVYSSLDDIFPYPILGELRSILQIFLVFITLMLLHRYSLIKVLKDVGLIKPILPGMLFGIIATLPMWIIFSAGVPLAPEFSLNGIFYLAFLSPFAEEMIFRGFAFGQIRRHAKLGFWPASIITGLVFGLGHIGFSQDFSQIIGIFLITGVGGILFAWIYEKWDYNLWVPFWLHCLMNLNWQIFDVGNSAFAGWIPTTLQLSVGIIAIVLTLYKNRIPFLSYGKRTT